MRSYHPPFPAPSSLFSSSPTARATSSRRRRPRGPNAPLSIPQHCSPQGNTYLCIYLPTDSLRYNTLSLAAGIGRDHEMRFHAFASLLFSFLLFSSLLFSLPASARILLGCLLASLPENRQHGSPLRTHIARPPKLLAIHSHIFIYMYTPLETILPPPHSWVDKRVVVHTRLYISTHLVSISVAPKEYTIPSHTLSCVDAAYRCEKL